jgi:hypothetical protein
MSYIRASQDGTYVDIPHGSNYYLYSDGSDIGGWSHEEFAGVVWDATQEIDLTQFDDEYLHEILDGFTSYFGGVEHDYTGGVAQPERAEIFCQCVDSRIDDVELTDELQTAMQDSFSESDFVEECEYCGAEFRPYISGEPYICNDDGCMNQHKADMYNVDVETIEELNRAYIEGGEEAHSEYWDEHIAPNIDVSE